MSFLIIGSQGNDILDATSLRSMLYHEGRNYRKEMVGRWRSEDEPGDGYHYKLNVDLTGYEKVTSSYLVYNGDYVKLKNLTFGYHVPEKILKKLQISQLHVYFNAQNLWTYKRSEVIDPENGSNGSSANPYPGARVYTLGFNIGF